MEPLDSAKLKVERANKHIRSLNTAISSATREADVTLREKGKLNIPNGVEEARGEGASIYELTIEPAIELDWGLVIGDILSNLRASLDHIAWALATQRCQEESISLTEGGGKSVRFPLRLRRAHTPYRTGVGLFRSDVQLFPDKVWDTIEYFQPYNRRVRPETALLGIIEELVNKDKHRIVTPTFRQVDFRLTDADQVKSAFLSQPSKFLFLVTDSMRYDLKPETVNNDIVLRGTFLFPKVFPVSDLSKTHDFIRDEVIPRFSSFFSK